MNNIMEVDNTTIHTYSYLCDKHFMGSGGGGGGGVGFALNLNCELTPCILS